MYIGLIRKSYAFKPLSLYRSQWVQVTGQNSLSGVRGERGLYGSRVANYLVTVLSGVGFLPTSEDPCAILHRKSNSRMSCHLRW